MKKICYILFAASILFTFSQQSINAQVKDPVKKTEKEGEKRVDKKVDKTINKSFDKLEEGLGGLFGKKKNKKNQKQETQTNSQAESPNQPEEQVIIVEKSVSPTLSWAKYDFVPGDKVIFEDDLSSEENGEFPSRWDLHRGNAEVAKYGEDLVIMLRDGHPSIIPYMKNPKEDYLPQVFTIEFDLYYPGSGTFEIHLYDRKNQKSGSPTGYTGINVTSKEMEMGHFRSRLPGENIKKSKWMHIAIAHTNGKLKAYMDETRLLNIPRLDFDPKGLTLYSYHAHNENLYYVKNIRIAEGGVKFYDRILQDGKIIASGIRFDVGKATLKPESMGIINKVTQLMKDHPEINFSVEGHTDSDGDDTSNLTLSEARAKTVKNTMVKLGISPDRLSAKGMGETTPMDTNDTPEGKANNRRVEFVKK
ncbi:OmpA family protein [Saccharicrinis sp. 156]|uniref:OmpA family protein n=1 Tax=Saccharicrinis sp. 156 TaxID=3417574 RepID=UPI003D340887